jgi:tetratricopeptide (TPR) repeat protein
MGEMERCTGEQDDMCRQGCMLMSLGYLQEAFETFNDVLEIDPNHELALVQKAIVLVKLEKYEDAVEAFEEIGQRRIVMDQKCRRYVQEAYFQKGVLLMEYSWMDEALDCFEIVLMMDNKHVQAWTCKGICLRDIGFVDEAVEAFDVALQLDPKFERASYLKEKLLQEMNQFIGREEVLLEKSADVSSSEEDEEEVDSYTAMSLIEMEKELQVELELEASGSHDPSLGTLVEEDRASCGGDIVQEKGGKSIIEAYGQQQQQQQLPMVISVIVSNGPSERDLVLMLAVVYLLKTLDLRRWLHNQQLNPAGLSSSVKRTEALTC